MDRERQRSEAEIKINEERYVCGERERKCLVTRDKKNVRSHAHNSRHITHIQICTRVHILTHHVYN